eukprot:jgi/Astpho2/571/Aster-04426
MLIKISFIFKLIIEIVGIGGLIAFGALRAACQEQTSPTGYSYGCDTDDTAAAVLEWVITACFGLYILSFVLDLYPSRFTSKHLATNNNQGKMVKAALSTSYPVAGPQANGENTQLGSGQDVQMAHQQVHAQQQPKVPHGTSIV